MVRLWHLRVAKGDSATVFSEICFGQSDRPGLITEAGAKIGEPSSACMGSGLPPCAPSHHLTGTVTVVSSLVVSFRADVAALSHKDTESSGF